MVICRFKATNASPSIYRKQHLGLTICGRFFLIIKLIIFSFDGDDSFYLVCYIIKSEWTQ